MVELKNAIAAIALIIIIIIAVIYFTAVAGKVHPQSGNGTSTQATSIMPNPLSNTTEQILNNINSQHSLNATYLGYEQYTYNQSGWHQSPITSQRNSSFMFQYEKSGNYSRINFGYAGQPNSSYLFAANYSELCAGSDVFALSNKNSSSLRCTILAASQAAQLMGFMAVGNFSFTGPGIPYSIQRSQITGMKMYQSSVNGSACKFTSGEIINSTGGNSSITFNQCVSSAYGIPLNYNITYYSQSGSASSQGGVTKTTTHVYGMLGSFNKNTNQSYVTMGG